MINTLANLALSAGHDILARPEVRAVEVAKEADIYRGLIGYGASETGISVTEETALNYVPWLCGTRIISETWACLPLKLYRRTPSGPEEALDHYLYPLFHDAPNPEMTAFSFWEAAGVSLCLYNNFYAELEWDSVGRLRAMWPLFPNRIEKKRTASGAIVFDYETDDGPVRFIGDDILHIPGCLSIDGTVATSLVKYAREAIGLGLAPQKFQSAFYKNNARPGMYLTTAQALNGEQRKRIIEAWDDVHKGIQGAGKTGVLEGGLELKVPSVTQKDSEFSATRDFQLLETCRVLRIPPHMMADLSRATFSNIENQDIGLAKHTMSPYCRRSEQALKLRVLGIRNQFYVKFAMDELMRGDLLSRINANAQAINTAQMTPNEARRSENRIAVDGGDRLYIQGANVPLDMAGANLLQQPKNDTPKTPTE
jgi:HK97 family phage portal protein